MSSNPAVPEHLAGNFAPVTSELTAFDLPVEGQIPPSLRGSYVRNGPNPQSGTFILHEPKRPTLKGAGLNPRCHPNLERGILLSSLSYLHRARCDGLLSL